MEQVDLLKKIEQLENDREHLLAEIRKLKRKPDGRIGYILLVLGFILVALAIYYSHNVATFIGIALTFWGALLLYIRPTRFIRKDILDSTITESSETYYKLIEELGYKGTPQHISPSTLWGLRNTVLFIPRSNNTPKPTDEQFSADEAIINDPQAIKLTPPGLGLSRLIENELKTDFNTVNLEYLQYNLEKALVEGLEIVEAFQMEISKLKVQVEMKATIFDQAIKDQNKEVEKRHIGNPLNSAIACIIARSTRKPIVIENIQIESNEKMMKVDFRILNQ
jgi:hypothetical protein